MRSCSQNVVNLSKICPGLQGLSFLVCWFIASLADYVAFNLTHLKGPRPLVDCQWCTNKKDQVRNQLLGSCFVVRKMIGIQFWSHSAFSAEVREAEKLKQEKPDVRPEQYSGKRS
jgi:hypothetical protein